MGPWFWPHSAASADEPGLRISVLHMGSYKTDKGLQHTFSFPPILHFNGNIKEKYSKGNKYSANNEVIHLIIKYLVIMYKIYLSSKNTFCAMPSSFIFQTFGIFCLARIFFFYFDFLKYAEYLGQHLLYIILKQKLSRDAVKDTVNWLLEKFTVEYNLPSTCNCRKYAMSQAI